MRVGRLPGCGRACPIRCRGTKLWAAVCGLPLALVASGCVGTPWGERLSGSFPPPQDALPGAQPASPQPASPQSPSPQPASQSPSGQPPSPRIPSSSPVSSRPETGPTTRGLNAPAAPPPSAPGAPSTRPVASSPQPPASQASPSPSSSSPFPYRVTLRLPRADPSAPAEAVTRALRAAGIPFEVETIERVKGGAAVPQSLEGSTGVPSVRPAPPPR